MASSLLVWLQLLATYLLHSSILFAGAWAVSKISRPQNPALLAATWKTAAVLPLVTAFLQCSSDWIPTRFCMPQTVDELIIQPRQSGEQSEPRWAFPVIPPEPAESVQRTHSVPRTTELADPSDFSEFPDLTPIHENPPINTREKLAPLVVWLCYATMISGAVTISIGLLRLFLQSIVFHRWISRCEPLQESSVQRILRRLLSNARLRHNIQLLTSVSVSQPIAFGVLRWTIVLPPSIHRRLRREELEALLAHELAHLVRHDGIWLWIGRFLCSCLAFQPLNFLMRRRWQQFSELCCDDWAVAHGTSGVALASCLIKVARWKLEQPCVFTALSMTGGAHTFTYRVERLLRNERCTTNHFMTRNYRPSRILLIAAALALMISLPRLSFPVALADDRQRFVQHAEIHPAYGNEHVDLFASLTQEFAQLDSDLGSAEQLAVTNPLLHGKILRLRQRATRLGARFRSLVTSRSLPEDRPDR